MLVWRLLELSSRFTGDTMPHRKHLSNPLFGRRLREAISAVARHKDWMMIKVEEELAEAIGKQVKAALTYHAVRHWKKGYPPNCERLQVIVRFCIQQGHISYDLAKALLTQGNCEHLRSMLDVLSPDASPPAQCHER